MRIWNRIRHSLAALGLAVLAAGTAAAADTKPAKPALWKVADADTSIYLFGTVHLLPAGYQWRTATFDRAASDAGTLVVETIVDEENPQAFLAELQRLSTRPGLPPLLERVRPEKRKALADTMARFRIPAGKLDATETWAAALALIQLQFHELGLSPHSGVEFSLRNGFKSAGKPIEQLESNSEQLGFFDMLPEDAQRELLEGAVDQPAEIKKQFDSMIRAWANGDVQAMARTFNSEFKASPELKQTLLKRRNANWSRWVESRMQRPGTVLMAVGAGHLAGTDSLIAMLKKRGLKVQRLQ